MKYNFVLVCEIIHNIWQSCKCRICNKILGQGNHIGPMHSMKPISQTIEPKCGKFFGEPS